MRSIDHELEKEVERRFFEMRWDGERKLSGTALQYGDVAKLPWNEKERFEPGAFGALGNADVILNVQHDRTRPIARTGGGGLTLRDDPQELAVSAELPNTRDADDALENVKQKILRGLSVEFIPKVTERDGDVLVIKKAELRAIAVVDKPAYPRSRLQPRSKQKPDEVIPMDDDVKKEIRELIQEAVSKRSDGAEDTTAALNAAVEQMGPVIERAAEAAAKAQVEKLVKERDEAEAKARAAEEERAAMKKKADEEEEEMMKKKADDEEEMQKKAEDRAELLLMVKPLLPSDLETRSMSDHDLMVQAVGDAVEGAAERSSDYLLAKIEGLIEQREQADKNIKGQAGGTTSAPAQHSMNEFQAAGGPNIHTMIERRERANAS